MRILKTFYDARVTEFTTSCILCDLQILIGQGSREAHKFSKHFADMVKTFGLLRQNTTKRLLLNGLFRGL